MSLSYRFPVLARLATCALLLGLTASPLTGCKKEPQVDPMKAAVSGYKQAVEPPIQKSEEISRLFVQIVLDEKGTPNPDNAAQRIQNEVVPKTKEYLEAVKAVQPKEKSLAETHQLLVDAATLRLEGYELIAQGFQAKNMDQFSQGQQKVTQSKIKEDDYVARANQLMRSQGYELVYFVAPPPGAP